MFEKKNFFIPLFLIFYKVLVVSMIGKCYKTFCQPTFFQIITNIVFFFQIITNIFSLDVRQTPNNNSHDQCIQL